MTRLLSSFVICCLAGLAAAQSSVQVYRHDRVLNRTDPMPLRPEWAPFYHGVASGDPLDDRVIIWTRVTPENMDGSAVEVDWEVAADPALLEVVRHGSLITGPGRDYTVKVDVDGLQPGTTYYYGFTCLGKHSLTGKTRTTPTGNQVDHLRFGVVSCSNYQAGYFNAYQRLAERNDLDAVIHLGDYIYEYANGAYGNLSDERPVAPDAELITLEDYRTRYSTYHLDTSLIRAHQQHPFIAVWDDHESANDAYRDGAENHDPVSEGDWETRKANAKQAYFEWMPIRDSETRSIYRSFHYGNLADLFMLDTRLEGRERQIFDVFDPQLHDAGRTILGAEQKAWLLDQLIHSAARWKLIGQQVVFSPLDIGFIATLARTLARDTVTTYATAQSLAMDIWNGYPAEREQIIDYIRDNGIDNTVILTGDFHTAFAFDVAEKPVDLTFQDLPGLGMTPFYLPDDSYDPATGEGAVAVEFATPSITSNNFEENIAGLVGESAAALFTSYLQQQIHNDITVPPSGPHIGNPNPHLKYPELARHGYFILDVRPDQVQADYFYGDILKVTNQETFDQGWYTGNGDNHLQRAAGKTLPKANPDIPAPPDPPLASSVNRPVTREPFVLLGVYPNPFQAVNVLHYSLSEKARLAIDLYDAAGRLVQPVVDEEVPPGLYTLELAEGKLSPGAYVYRIRANGRSYGVRVVKER